MRDLLSGLLGWPPPGLHYDTMLSGQSLAAAQQNVTDAQLAEQWGRLCQWAEEYRRWRARADEADELREAHNRMAEAARQG